MIIKLNAEDYTVKGANTVKGLLDELDIQTERVAVELNLKVIKKADYQMTQIQDGDTVEIVNFVGGG
ncbi:sulfur carrier protein ThiS [Candidatus Magnetomonas plexicatena]|uniref:sulfur carrier protein ThiS n=1 Tax=Candidatus Magnetomonas plexicatena TaxID=2552947 RepID=UPI0011002D0E|nr:sulfur carrier protein ThiS [Nitrospirales bacterium LBB_01]